MSSSTAGRILFSRINGIHGNFSNFSNHPVSMPVPIEALKSSAAKSSPAALAALQSLPNEPSSTVLVTFPTSEHYFQAMKFPLGSDAFYACVDAEDGAATKKAGGNRSATLREDWNSFRHQVMYDVLMEKFGDSNPELRDELLSTGSAELVEHAPWDSYWGDGGDGSGRNHLGKTLMRVREDLQKAKVSQSDTTDELADVPTAPKARKPKNRLQ